MGSILTALLIAEVTLRWRDMADPPAFAPDARYGYLMRPNQSVATHGYRFRINRFGQRGDDFKMPKLAGDYRVFFLGDSVTYGGGTTPDPSLFVNRVASSLSGWLQRPVDAVNASAPNWGLGNMFSYVQTAGLFDADLLVWVIPSCDFRRPTTSLSDDIGLPSTKPPLRLAFIFRVAWLYAKWAVASLRQHLRPSHDRLAAEGSSSQILTHNLAVLRQGIGWIRGRGLLVAVVLVPSGTPAGTGYNRPGDFQAFHAVAESSSVPILDITSALAGRPGYFIDGIHLNVQGNKVVADAIATFLEQTYFRTAASTRASSVSQASLVTTGN